MHSSPEYQTYCRTDPCRMIRQSKAHATIEPKRIVELMVEAAKGVGAWWGIRLRVVLTENFSVDACVLMEMETERERLLAPVTASL